MARKVVHDKKSGQVFIRQNEARPPENMHEIIRAGVDYLDSRKNGKGYNSFYPGEPGRHAEVLALNDAYLARGGAIGLNGLADFTLSVANTIEVGPTFGQPFIRCWNCRVITLGVDVISDRLDLITGSDVWHRKKLQGFERYALDRLLTIFGQDPTNLRQSYGNFIQD